VGRERNNCKRRGNPDWYNLPEEKTYLRGKRTIWSKKDRTGRRIEYWPVPRKKKKGVSSYSGKKGGVAQEKGDESFCKAGEKKENPSKEILKKRRTGKPDSKRKCASQKGEALYS